MTLFLSLSVAASLQQEEEEAAGLWEMMERLKAAQFPLSFSQCFFSPSQIEAGMMLPSHFSGQPDCIFKQCDSFVNLNLPSLSPSSSSQQKGDWRIRIDAV